jgi:hypothetical protein
MKVEDPPMEGGQLHGVKFRRGEACGPGDIEAAGVRERDPEVPGPYRG